MKKVFWLIIVIILMTGIINALDLTVSATESDFDFNGDASNYAEINYLCDGTKSYDGYLDFGERIYVNVENILTPNGNEFEVYETLNDFSATYISAYNNYYDSHFPNAIRLSTATARYNCHSYAWYSQNTSSNHYWMNYPCKYYDIDDKSYGAVDTPRIGDIICYFDDNGTPNNLVDDDNLHSGIIVNYDSSIMINNVCGNSNQVTVISKWGPAGLYQHMGDYCPYTSTFGGAADYVKYYRPRTNMSYTLSQYSPTETIPLSINGLSSNIIDKYGMYELNVNYQKNYQINVSSSYSLDVRLYDEHMQVLINNPTNTYSSGTYTVSISQNLSVGRYYLRVAYQNTSNSGNITVQIIGHTHLYTNSYTWVNYNQHRSFCVCGSNRLEVHAVAAKSLGDDLEYLTCILCGGPANAGIVPWDKGIQITNNGSFISPNGILVLADEDIEGFLSGEIAFEYDDIEVSRNIDIPPYLLKKDEDYF